MVKLPTTENICHIVEIKIYWTKYYPPDGDSETHIKHYIYKFLCVRSAHYIPLVQSIKHGGRGSYWNWTYRRGRGETNWVCIETRVSRDLLVPVCYYSVIGDDWVFFLASGELSKSYELTTSVELKFMKSTLVYGCKW